MEDVLVIGGAGYIGSALVATTGWRSIDLPHRYLDVYPIPKTVVFLAGHTDVAACTANPTEARKNNVEDFEKFVLRCKHLVFASTMLVYGDGGPFGEDSSLFPASEYARQKIEAEKLCNGKIVLRFGVVCGNSPKLKQTTLINKMVADARNGKVTVAGPNFWRPILGVRDTCRALIKTVENYQPGTYNLCSFNANILDIGKYVAEKSNAKLEVVESVSPGIQMKTDKFREVFKWEPECSLQSVVEELLCQS